MKQVHRKDLDIIQSVLDKMNERVNIEHDIELWNHCIDSGIAVGSNEQIEIIED